MRILKYKSFLESIQIDLEHDVTDLLESLDIYHDSLLSSIGAQLTDIYHEFKLPRNFKIDIDFLSENIEFINSLSSLGLKISQIQNTEDFETFIDKPCKFMFIYKFQDEEIDNPEYMLFQVWNETLMKWEEAKLYKLTEDVRKFYDKLSSKIVELVYDGERYIYQSSNGNEWELQNADKANDIFKKYLRKDDLQKVALENKVKVTII